MPAPDDWRDYHGPMTTPSDIKRDFERAEDPLRYFQLRGLVVANELGLDPARINDVLGILCSVFGEDWLRESADDVRHGEALPLRQHPIGDLIHAAGAEQVAELVELTEYLTSVADSPVFGALVDGLRADYEGTLLQLAFAHRFAQIGVRGLTLEPPARDGRFGDIAFSYGDAPFTVECYRPRSNRGAMKECELLVFQILETLPQIEPVYSVAIALNRMPSVMDRREIIRLVAELARGVDADQKGTHGVPCRTAIGELATVSVCRVLASSTNQRPTLLRPRDFPHQGDDFRLFVRKGIARESEVKSVYRAPLEGPGLSHVALWLAPEDEEEMSIERDITKSLERLGRKIEAKLAQTRAPGDPRRIMIVHTWMTSQLHRTGAGTVERLRAKLVEAHEGVAGVLLVLREWSARHHRHRYAAHVLTRQPTTDRGLLSKLATREQGDS